ncbi:SusC/RagA family TonB-linked outer membrane protein [Echinicola rosea]|uniref:SusC/RagA family TonB-linked outer membrane protein n=2 Tax=Echinicola rosea TaxID=1807691 RepID=A0ABQ1UU71_9BACT|nr:SusC/RagA family TonB-linked outer membrane protein [Echinicola rosea]
MAYGQEVTITGTVTTAEDGEPLPGVSVLLKGSTRGAVTDLDGNYSLNASSGDGSLVFSYLGYLTHTTAINNRTRIDVVMKEDVSEMGEVVVTALGITRDERSIGYATQEVDGDNLTFTKEQNVLGSLSGKVAGVQVEGASGASMGGTQKIKIRGVNSISGASPPLIVVDGTPISNANFSGDDGVDLGNLGQDVNPEDIESVNVLKGPAASALYGIRGQYGVVMITTKKGKRGSDVKVELNSAVFVENVYNIMPYQNMYGGGSSQEWPTLPNGDRYVQMNVDESWGPIMDGSLVRHAQSFYPQDPEYGQLAPFVPHPDNIKDYYETGTNVNNGVTISGGGENSNFRISLNDTRIQGVEPNTMLKRNNIGVSLGVDLTKKLNISTNVNYATNRARRPGQGSEDGSRYMGQWFQRSLDMNRLKNYKYDDGSFFHWNLSRPSTTTGEINDFTPLYWDNPYYTAYENFSEDNRDRLFGNVGLTYEVIPDLKLSGFIRTDTYTQNLEFRSAFGGKGLPGYTVGKYQNTEMNYEFLAQYNKTWDKFSIDANVGSNFYDRKYSYLRMATVGGLSSPGFYNIDASIDRPSNTSYKLRKQIKSAYAMVSLGFDNTYFLDASIRNDNTSTLPEGNNSYWYPSVSGSMVFSELIDWEPMTLGKLRVSYAQAGSDLSPYGTTLFYGAGTVYAGPSGTVNTLYVPDNLNNPTLEPSFAHSYEAGLDFKFLEGRVGLAFTYYQQINKNQILQLDLSGASGFGSATINAGQIRNKGFELALTGTAIKNSLVNWDIALNLSRNRNEVVELYPGIDVYQYDYTVYSSVYSYLNSYEGKPFGSLVGQAYQRDESTGKILLDGNNMPLYTAATNDFGTVLPDFNGGFQNVVSIGNFDLSAMIDFQVGGQFFSRSKMLAVRTGLDPLTVATNDQGANVRDDVSEGGGVRVEGISAETGEEVVAYVDARNYYRNVLGRRIYEEWLYDGSYVRLREVRVGYNFTKDKLGNIPVENVRVALVGRNLGMIFQNAPKGINPAEISTGSQSIGWYESGQLPSVRSLGFNLNVTF